MSVSNGEDANETTFNQSFMSREVDTSTTGKVDLNNVDAASGSSVTNLQRNINSLASMLGVSINQAYNAVVTWANAYVGSSSSTVKAKIEALVLLFRGTTANGGHAHSGVDGDGAPVSAANLANWNNFWCVPTKTTIGTVSGTSSTVTSAFTGKTSGGGASAAGVITDSGNNKVDVINATTNTFLEDAGGQRVYGRLTESSGVWTLTYYTNEAGVETSTSLSSTSIFIINREVFTSANRPTLGSNPSDWGTLDVTGDVVDASTSQRGVVTTGTQSFAGAKTFTGDLISSSASKLFETNDTSTTGSAADLTLPSTPAIRLSHASLTGLRSVASPARGLFLLLVNDTGNTISVKNQSAGATAANRIITGTGADFNWLNGASIILYYENNSTRWRMIGGGGSTGGNNISIDWFTDETAPTEQVSGASYTHAYRFDAADTQNLYGIFKVPNSYVAGTQLRLQLPFAVNAASGTSVLNFTSVLVRSGTDTAGSVTNTETGSSSVAVTNGVMKTANLALTDATGKVNSVSVSAGDIIKFKLTRSSSDGVSGSMDIYAKAAEVI